jgi:hypothetical protein
MGVSMRTIWTLLVFLAAAGAPALANPDGDMLRKLNLLGKWAEDCSREADDDNAVLFYSAPKDAPPTERIEMGEYERTYAVFDVVVLADGKVQWTQEGDSGDLTIVNLIESNRLKTWRSVNSAGEVLIKDGKFAAGDEAPWFYRCDAQKP